MDKGVWEEAVRKNADEEGVGPCDRHKGGVCTTKRKGISTVKGRKRGGKRICEGAVVKRVYLAVKVTTNGTGILCGKKGWKEANSTRVDN